jgi:hypothetical protein
MCQLNYEPISNYRVNPAAGVTAVASAAVRSPAAGYAGRYAY